MKLLLLREAILIVSRNVETMVSAEIMVNAEAMVSVETMVNAETTANVETMVSVETMNVETTVRKRKFVIMNPRLRLLLMITSTVL